jgi:hypothetical protein
MNSAENAGLITNMNPWKLQNGIVRTRKNQMEQSKPTIYGRMLAVMNTVERTETLLLAANQALAEGKLDQAEKLMAEAECYSSLPRDYETCGECGFDHGYEPAEASDWHGKFGG